jgi:hypothetical protein
MLRPDVQKTRSFVDGARERISFAPMSEEEDEIISIEEYAILQYHDHYRKALKEEVSWWEVYSDEETIEAEIAFQKRVKAALHERTEVSIKQDASFFEPLFAHKRARKECEMAAFAVRFGQKPKITVKVIMVENDE